MAVAAAAVARRAAKADDGAGGGADGGAGGVGIARAATTTTPRWPQDFDIAQKQQHPKQQQLRQANKDSIPTCGKCARKCIVHGLATLPLRCLSVCAGAQPNEAHATEDASYLDRAVARH